VPTSNDPTHKPIRLKVAYKRAHTLVTQYTRTISKGSCCIESSHALEPGTRFVFEMYTTGIPQPVEVDGEVIRCEPCPAGWAIVVRYLAADARRLALEAVLDRLFAAHVWEKTRRHPRIPVNVPVEDSHGAPRFIMTDVSLGGFGLMVVDGGGLPPELKTGTPALLTVQPGAGAPIDLSADVVWTGTPSGPLEPRMGLAFESLTDLERTVVDLLSRLHRPTKLSICFLL